MNQDAFLDIEKYGGYIDPEEDQVFCGPITLKEIRARTKAAEEYIAQRKKKTLKSAAVSSSRADEQKETIRNANAENKNNISVEIDASRFELDSSANKENIEANANFYPAENVKLIDITYHSPAKKMMNDMDDSTTNAWLNVTGALDSTAAFVMAEKAIEASCSQKPRSLIDETLPEPILTSLPAPLVQKQVFQETSFEIEREEEDMEIVELKASDCEESVELVDVGVCDIEMHEQSFSENINCAPLEEAPAADQVSFIGNLTPSRFLLESSSDTACSKESVTEVAKSNNPNPLAQSTNATESLKESETDAAKSPGRLLPESCSDTAVPSKESGRDAAKSKVSSSKPKPKQSMTPSGRDLYDYVKSPVRAYIRGEPWMRTEWKQTLRRESSATSKSEGKISRRTPVPKPLAKRQLNMGVRFFPKRIEKKQ